VHRATGPYLQLVIEPIRGIIKENDELLKDGLANPVNVFEDFEESSTSITSIDVTEIDPALLSHNASQSEDDWKTEIANAWNAERDSGLVFIPQEINLDFNPEAEQKIWECSNETDTSDSDTMDEVGKEQKDDILQRQSIMLSNRQTGDARPGLHLPHVRGSAPDIAADPSDEGNPTPNIGNKTRPSIITFSNSEPSILELGPGLIGIQDLSLSYLHCKKTPNPHTFENDTDKPKYFKNTLPDI